MHRLLLALLSLPFLAGCLDGGGDDASVDGPAAPADGRFDVRDVVNASIERGLPMAFTERVVTAAVTYASDLYEPTLEVSRTGVVYITGHTIGADTTGAPIFRSLDDGQTWEQLPFFGATTMPGTLHGATPPPSDEIFLSAGDDGWLYGVDITLATFPVNAWSGDGAELAWHNPNAYDEHQAALQAAECTATPAKDRPWGAYANGTLLMVSNPAAGPAQVGVLPVPAMVGGLLEGAPLGVGSTAFAGKWNMCAGPGYSSTGCSIPGIPDIRADGRFAVPQRCDGRLYLVVGDAVDVMEVDLVSLFPHVSGGEITSVYGIAAFDAAGDLFVGITNNTAADPDGNRTGQLRFVASTDAGQTFRETVYTTGATSAVRHFYMDANEVGSGALVVWAIDGSGRDAEGDVSGWDWFVGHLQLGADGTPELVDAFLAIDEGPQPSAHVTGAGVGPDGRAYLAMFQEVEAMGNPLSVWVQTEGPRLPAPAA